MNAMFRPSTITVREIDLTDANELRGLERFVADHPSGTPFHRPAWILAVARGTGNRARFLVAGQGADPQAILPLVDVRSPLFGRVLVSSGFGVGGGVLGGTEAGSCLLAAAEDLATREACPAIELRGGQLPIDRENWTIRSDTHCGFERPLADDDATQLTDIPRKQRAEVRKGLAGDFTIRVGTGPANRAAHYAVYAESVRNLGTPVYPKRLFAEVLDALGDDADILTVFHQGIAVASVLSLYHGGAVMPYWGGGTAAARKLRANDRMYFELMLHARRRGCDRFDFGRSKAGSGPCDFKKNWGFAPVPLAYAAWTAPGAAPRDADPASARHAQRIAVWKRLPLRAANLLGPLIARGLG